MDSHVHAVYIVSVAQVILYASMSLDGFATGPDDDLSALHGWAFGDSSMEMHPHVSSEFSRAGAVIFGARTLRAGDAAWGDESIFTMPVFVVTHEVREPAIRNGALFTYVGSADEAVGRALSAAGIRDVYIMGSPNVAQQLISGDMVDEVELAITGIILGSGVRLFDQLAALPLRLDPTRVIPSRGITHVRYTVRR